MKILNFFKKTKQIKSRQKTREKLVVISTYPSRGANHDKGTIGIAPFTKNTVLSLKQTHSKLDITVLAEKHSVIPDFPALAGLKRGSSETIRVQDDTVTYTERGITVKRLWKRNSLSTFLVLLKEIVKNHKATQKVLVQFGFGVYGEIFYLLPLPLFLFILRVLKKEVYIVFHEVVPDANEIHGHINIQKNSFQAGVLNTLFKLFYTFLLAISTKSIVLEDTLKERLKEFGEGKKIATIPIGVEAFSKNPTKRDARKSLNIKNNSYVLLAFGFLAWYKGTDWIAEQAKIFSQTKKSTLGNKKIELIIAGGANPNRASAYYKRYVNGLENKCRENNIRLTGFIEERDIPLYFQAADLVVFPYRAFMGASAPLTLAYSFKKPFLVSEAMRGIFKSQDVEKALVALRLKKEKLFFGHNGDLVKKVRTVQKNAQLSRKAIALSGMIAKNRTWKHMGEQYYGELFNG